MDDKLKGRPTEFFDGEWRIPTTDGGEPWAIITYADEPSPETGHVGWCWWALGKMGDAPTYEAARNAAVAEIQRVMDRRMAVHLDAIERACETRANEALS